MSQDGVIRLKELLFDKESRELNALTRRLEEVAERAGCRFSVLIERASDIPWAKLEGATAVGITAGASAPEIIVEEVIEAFRQRYDVSVEIVTTLEERVVFNVPRELRANAPAGSI